MRIISGLYRSQTLLPFQQTFIRPVRDRVREAVFNMISSLPEWQWENSIALDVFAGTGALGLEALSRGARRALFVEIEKSACDLIDRNSQKLGIPKEKISLFRSDLFTLKAQQSLQEANIIFIDPPYGLGLAEKALHALFPLEALYVIFEEYSQKDKVYSGHFHPVKQKVFGKTWVRLLKSTLPYPAGAGGLASNITDSPQAHIPT